MFIVNIKAYNNTTKEILYSGIKKEFETYRQAVVCMRKTLKSRYAVVTSYHLPDTYGLWKGSKRSCYVTCRHWSCKTTLYLTEK